MGNDWGFGGNTSGDDSWGLDSKPKSKKEDSLNDWSFGGSSGSASNDVFSLPQNEPMELDAWDKDLGGLNPEDGSKKPFYKSKKLLVGVGAVVIVGLTVGIVLKSGHRVKALPEAQTSYYELNNVEKDIRSANVDNLQRYVGSSYLAMEWKYFNNDKSKQDFYNKVMSSVTLDSPSYNDLRTEIPVKVTHIDWSRVMTNSRDFDFKQIQKMYADKGIKKTDYEFNKELTDLFATYISSLGQVPTTTDNVTLQMKYTKTTKGYGWNLVDDSPIDNVLFSSDSFHKAEDVFAGIATGDIGTLSENPNWTEWNTMYTNLNNQLGAEEKNLQEFNKVVTNDNGTVLNTDGSGKVKQIINLDKTTKDTSANRDRINAPVVDNPDLTVVNAIKNELKVMKENEPLHTFIQPSSQPLGQGTLIPYKWVGAYYLQHNYTENGLKK